MAIEIKSEAARLLAEIGFLGLGRGLPAEAGRVFAALRALRPADEAGHVGLALAALAGRDAAGAVAILRQGPQTEAVMAFSCVAFARLGDKAAVAEIHADLLAMGAAAPIIAIAKEAMGHV
jgi:hypothetical protein